MSEEHIPNEYPLNPEIPTKGWNTLILLQRHGAYDTRRPVDRDHLTDEEKQYGKLTDEGVRVARARAKQRVDDMLAGDAEHTDFLLVTSSTHWLGIPELGQRAVETGEIIADEIRHALDKSELRQSQLLKPPQRFDGQASRTSSNLEEARMFDQSPVFAEYLRDMNGGKQDAGFWQDFFSDKYQSLREEESAEGPEEIAQRIDRSVTKWARFAKWYHRKYPERRLVIWGVTHGDDIPPFAQRRLGLPVEEVSYNDGLVIAINPQGHGIVRVGEEFSGREFN